ncbi:MAG TPA: hypothetical protein VFR43_05185 [Gaiellaceae bacterium]|nr:hypothetical protein [Gaiellaceae bacterium]
MAVMLLLASLLATFAVARDGRRPTRAELELLPDGRDRPRPRPRLRRPALGARALYEAVELRLGGTAVWNLLARLGERAGARSSPAETLLFSAGAGQGLAVLAAAAGAQGAPVVLALVLGASALPGLLAVQAARRPRPAGLG